MDTSINMNLELERSRIQQIKNIIKDVGYMFKKERTLILDTIQKLNIEISDMDKKMEYMQECIDKTTDLIGSSLEPDESSWENDKKLSEKYSLLNSLYLFRNILQQLISDDIEYNTKYKKEVKCVKNMFYQLDIEDYVQRTLARVKSFINFIKNNSDIIYATNSFDTWQTAKTDNTEQQVSLKCLLSNLSDKDKRTINILAINISRDIHYAGM